MDAERAFVRFGPWAAAVAWLVVFVAGGALSPWPVWYAPLFAAVQVAVALSFGVADVDLLRSWGTTRAGTLVVGGIVVAWCVAFAVPIIGGDPALVAGAIESLCLTGLVVVYVLAKQVAARLPRRAEWEVLHRVSAISAKAEPLTQPEAIDRAPEFLAMIEDANRFRTTATSEYLDLFEEQARFDLGLAASPADPKGLDDRWQTLHRELSWMFAPYRTWAVPPIAPAGPVPRAG